MPQDLGAGVRPGATAAVARTSAGAFPFPVPNGWFIVAAGDELAPGEVVPLYYFGRDLVLFRGEDGAPLVVDAYCPHLGAHLAVGGQVEDDCIRCPFHGWKFDGETGQCVEIPYDEDQIIPPGRRSAASRLERNHMIWAWHHLEGGAPFYDVPEVPEFDDHDWSPIVVRDFEIATCCQEMAENNVDFAHFKYVHGTDAIPEDEFVIDGTYKRTVGMDGNFVREGFGLGLGVLRVKGYTTFMSHDPDRREQRARPLDLHLTGRARRERGREGGGHVLRRRQPGHPDLGEQGLPRPAGDHAKEKLILEHRRWSRQFYSFPEEASSHGD